MRCVGREIRVRRDAHEVRRRVEHTVDLYEAWADQRLGGFRLAVDDVEVQRIVAHRPGDGDCATTTGLAGPRAGASDARADEGERPFLA